MNCLRYSISLISCISGRFLGNYLIILYFSVKCMFGLNVICQIFLLSEFLGQKFQLFGIEVLKRMLAGQGWDSSSKYFPKVTLCDLKVREPGHPQISHQYTVQCVLPINLFNQQIFTFIWFWYIIVLVVTVYDIAVWAMRFLPSKRYNYIERRLRLMANRNKMFELKAPASCDHFIYSYLETDGIFMLRLLSTNTSDFVCTEIIQSLWMQYSSKQNNRKTSRSSIKRSISNNAVASVYRHDSAVSTNPCNL
ncbi:hypothetical protein ACOME3_001303 [Neoechinorhynchus agilis]